MHPLKQLVADRAAGRVYGIYSACTANEWVIEAVFRRAQAAGQPALIEATANQVNQFGGYTGMRPADFAAFVHAIADRAGFPRERLILGGDHLGPLVWQDESADSAMEKAKTLVADFARAGYTKLHLDTSMRLAGDDRSIRLSDKTIAARSAELARAALEALPPGAEAPVFVIGSEVPVPGGEQEAVSSIAVTRPEDMQNTLDTFERVFASQGLSMAWNNTVALVVQPGVEFGDTVVFPYDRTAAAELHVALAAHPGLVLEGHSTDYQPPERLREMVEDGVCILKVGPALTFYLREALFSLEAIETRLCSGEPSRFAARLEKVMLANPRDWQKYYVGTQAEVRFKRQFSYSDRCRYYLPQVSDAVDALLRNLSRADIPLPLLSQYMPVQAARVRDGKLSADPVSLMLDRVGDCIDGYLYAVGAPGFKF